MTVHWISLPIANISNRPIVVHHSVMHDLTINLDLRPRGLDVITARTVLSISGSSSVLLSVLSCAAVAEPAEAAALTPPGRLCAVLLPGGLHLRPHNTGTMCHVNSRACGLI